MKSVPKDRNGKISKKYLRVVLDLVAPSAGLPPFGAVDQVLLRTLNQITFSRFLSNWQLIGNYCEAGYPLITKYCF